MEAIEKWIVELSTKSDKFILSLLDDTVSDIRFLESIYITGKQNNVFSKEFSDEEYKERQNLCQLSSALYQIKRDRKL